METVSAGDSKLLGLVWAVEFLNVFGANAWLAKMAYIDRLLLIAQKKARAALGDASVGESADLPHPVHAHAHAHTRDGSCQPHLWTLETGTVGLDSGLWRLDRKVCVTS